MSTFLATYDPDEVIIQLNGQDIVGFPEGDMVTVEKNEDFFNNTVGSKGEVSRAVNRNNTGVVTIRLQHTSPSIKLIEGYKLFDVNGFPIPPVVELSVIDPASYDKVFAAFAWLNTDASHSWGNEVGVREYQFFAVNIVTGINANVSTGVGFGQFTGLI